MSASLHYAIYCLIAIVAIADLILTVFLFKDVQDHSSDDGGVYHRLLIVSIGTSTWTIFFGFMYALMIRAWLVHFLENVSLSLWWLVFTSVLWATTVGIFHRSRKGDICDGMPALSNCRQSLTVESLGWTELGLCLLTICTTWVWITDESLSAENNWSNYDSTSWQTSALAPSQGGDFVRERSTTQFTVNSTVPV